jgi:16S rRNA (guanine1207-N2)-methyltransferase
MKLQQPKALSVLDLGCGYGFLSVRAIAAGLQIKRLCLTDNNAAALLSAKQNLSQHYPGPQCSIVAADCADQVSDKFDLILCNPPFHQGFSVDDSLSDRFLRSAKNRLKPKGQAIFVVNSFISLEKKALGIFDHVQCLINNKQFKVLLLA